MARYRNPVLTYLIAGSIALLAGCLVGTMEGCAAPERGPAGQSAEPCTVEANEHGGMIRCPGSPVQIENGGAGAQGLPGDAGSVVTPIQFCTGTPAPGTWLESGLCIDSALYAVFWQSGKPFLALLPPGTYETTDGAACVFSVGPNCQVSR